MLIAPLPTPENRENLMKTALALLVLAVTTPATGVDAIRFAPAIDSAVRKTFEQDLELSQIAHTTVVDGEAQTTEGGQDISQRLRLSVVDRYAALTETGVSELRRSFDSIAMSSTRMETNALTERPRALAIEMESPFEGRVVVFRADEGAELKPTLEGDGAALADELLAGLSEDTDLRLFLPPSAEVAEGTRWAIDPQALANVLAPAGDLRFEAQPSAALPGDAQAPPNPGSSPLDGWVSGEVEGAVLATFANTSTVEGQACAVIQIEIDLSSTRDTTESAREKFASVPMPEGGDMALTLDFSEAVCVLQGEGELVWELEAGRFRSFTLEARIGLVVDTAATIQVGDDRRELEIRDEFSGSLRVLQDAHAE